MADETGTTEATELRKLFVAIGAWQEDIDFSTLSLGSSVREGFEARMEAFAMLIDQKPGLAAEAWAESSEAFAQAIQDHPEFANVLEIYRCHADSQHESALGFEDQSRFDFAGAMAAFQRATVALEEIVDEKLPRFLDAEDDHVAIAVLERLQDELPIAVAETEGLADQAAYRAASARGDYAGAARAAESFRDRLVGSLAVLPTGLADEMRRLLQMSAARATVDADFARARCFRSEQRWDEALAAYEQARTDLREAAKRALRSGLPNAKLIQESLMSQAANAIEPAVRDLKEERRLREALDEQRRDYEELRTAVIARLEGQQQVKLTTETNVQVDARLTAVQQQLQHTEQSVRTELKGLAAALAASDLEDRDRLSAEAAELANTSDEQGQGFLDKAAAFTEKVTGIMKNVDAAAGPVGKVLGALGKLLPLAVFL